jgi:hypothetical protein
VLTKHCPNFLSALSFGLDADIEGAVVYDELLSFRILQGSLKILRHQVL